MTRLIHCTDLHFWKVVYNPFRLLSKRVLGNFNVWYRRRHEFLTDNAADVADYIAGLGAGDVFLGGDFTSTALEEEFEMAAKWMERLEQRKLNLHVVPGNHDVYTFNSARIRRFEKVMARHMPEEGYPAVRTLANGASLILAPTACPNYISSRGRITSPLIEHVVKLVQESPDEVVLVGAHYPVLEKTPWFTTDKSRCLRGADEFRHALGESGKRVLYLCGHAHRFGYIADPDHPSLSHVCTGALFLRKHGQMERGTFTEVQIEGGEPRIILHRLVDGWAAEEMELRRF